jgi:hypothetical protein
MRLLRMTAAIVAVMLVLPARAADVCTTLQQIVESYLLNKHDHPKKPIRVGVYDAKTHEWHAFRWNGVNAEPEDGTIEVPVSNEPTLYVRHTEDVAVLVVHANSLLYSGEVTKVERTDIEGLKELQAFASLLGSTLPGLPHVDLISHDVSVESVQTMQRETSRLEIEAFEQRKGLKWPIQPRQAKELIGDARDSIAPLVDQFIAALDREYGPIRDSVNKAVPKIEQAKKRGLDLDAARLRVSDALQFAELGTPAKINQTDADLFTTAPTTVRTDFNDAVSAAAAIPAAAPLCTDSLASLNTIFNVLLDTTPADDDEKEADEKSVRAALTNLRKSAITADCIRPDQNPPDETELTKTVLALADWLRTPDNRAAAVDAEVAGVLNTARRAIVSYRRAFESRKAVLEQATALSDVRAKTLTLAIQLQQFGDLYKAQASDPQRCWYTAGVVEVERIQKNGLDLPWFEVQNEDFTVSVRTMFKDDVIRNLPDEVKGKYTLSHGNYGLGVDTALVFTHANDREYVAVEEHVNEDVNDDKVIDEKDTRFFIHEKSRTARTGKLALMLTLAPPRFHGLGVQFGLGVDTDNPAAFLGATWSVGKFARISVGHTQQRVTRLVGDQFVGGTVKGADALSTRERFDTSWYAALAFTISKLSIFKTD